MKLRNGKIANVEKVFYEKLEKFKKIMEAKKIWHIQIDFYYDVPDFFSILNKYMDRIDILCIKNKKNKQFDVFLVNIPQLEKIIKSIRNFNEGRYAFLRDNLEKTITISLKKIENYKKIYKREINEVLCRLSSKIGIDNTKEVESYLQAF